MAETRKRLIVQRLKGSSKTAAARPRRSARSDNLERPVGSGGGSRGSERRGGRIVPIAATTQAARGPGRCRRFSNACSTVIAVERVEVPPELLWDYREPPEDPIWRLQRIAEWFPAFGRDRATVAQLYAHRRDLRVPPEVRALIEIYEEAWSEREVGGGDR
jgi:hypothetical protein